MFLCVLVYLRKQEGCFAVTTCSAMNIFICLQEEQLRSRPTCSNNPRPIYCAHMLSIWKSFVRMPALRPGQSHLPQQLSFYWCQWTDGALQSLML